MALRLSRPDLAVVALDSVQYNLQRQLRYQAAYESARRRLELARDAGDLGELGDSFAVASWNAIFIGSFREARALGREGYELLYADGPMYAVHALCWAALAAFYLGDWDGCLHDFASIVAGLSARGQSLTSGFATPWPAVALIHEARGDRADSQRLLEEVYNIEQRRRKRASTALSPLIVQTLLLHDELQAARARFDAAVESDSEPDNPPLLQLAQVELLTAEGKWEELDSLATAMRRLATSTGARYLAPAADRASGRAAAAAGAPEEAFHFFDAAVTGFDAVEMRVEAALARLDAAEAALVLGRGSVAKTLTAAAVEPLRPAGFLRGLARADALDLGQQREA
jgi:tetratricopeptide (TPR) repeat protein